jgi:hypothetical protein
VHDSLYEPFVEKVVAGATALRQETFGPIIAIQKVKSEEETLYLANDSEHGLEGKASGRLATGYPYALARQEQLRKLLKRVFASRLLRGIAT